jgi:hypothetical protein
MLVYYIYAYLRKSDNTPYYIGKGKNKRAWSKEHRVSVPKDKSKIVIMEKNLTEIGALSLERRYIKWYGRKDNGTGILLNKTDGGDTTIGYLPTEQVRKKISESLKGRKKPKGHGEKVSKFRKSFKYSEESKIKIGNSNKGKKRTEEQKKQQSLKQLGRKQPESQKIKTAEKLSKNYKLIDPMGKCFIIFNLRKFCLENGLDQGNMVKVSQGILKQHKGWTCYKIT